MRCITTGLPMNQAAFDKKVFSVPSSTFPACGLFLHASAVLGPKGAILLLGHSGSGKTSLCKILSPYFSLIADDITFVCRRKCGVWEVRDGDSFRPELFKNRSVSKNMVQKAPAYPLGSIIRIFASQSTVLQPLAPMKLCEYLMDAVFEIDIQRKTIRSDLTVQWFHHVAAIAKQNKGWQLQFALDKKLILSAFQGAGGEWAKNTG